MIDSLPCVWRGTDIIVLDEVLVKAPEYSSKDVQLLSTKKTKAANEGTLNRVKTIVCLFCFLTL